LLPDMCRLAQLCVMNLKKIAEFTRAQVPLDAAFTSARLN